MTDYKKILSSPLFEKFVKETEEIIERDGFMAFGLRAGCSVLISAFRIGCFSSSMVSSLEKAAVEENLVGRMVEEGKIREIRSLRLAVEQSNFEAPFFLEEVDRVWKLIEKAKPITDKPSLPPSPHQLNTTLMELRKFPNSNKKVVDFLSKNAKLLSPVNRATGLTNLSKAKDLASAKIIEYPEFGVFMRETSEILERDGFSIFGMRESCSILHSASKMGCLSSSMINSLEMAASNNLVEELLSNNKTQELASLVWAVLQAKREAPIFLEEVERNAELFVKCACETGNHRHLSQVLHSFSKSPQGASLLFAAVENSVDDIISSGFLNSGVIDTHAISSLFYAFARMEKPPPKLFAALDESSGLFLASAIQQNNIIAVSNVMWSFAHSGIKSEKLFGLFDDLETTNRFVTECVKQDSEGQFTLSNVLWSLATQKKKFGHEDDNTAKAFFKEVDKHAKWYIRTALKAETMQGVSNAIWAFSTVGAEGKNIFPTLSNNASAFIKRTTESKNPDYQAISNVVWAYGREKHPRGIMYAAVESEADWFVQNAVKHGDIQAVSIVLWSFTKTGNEKNCPGLFAAVEKESLHFVEKAVQANDIQVLSNIAWSLARVDDTYKSPLFFDILSKHAARPLVASALQAGQIQELSNLLWAFSKVVGNNNKPPTLFLAAVDELSEKFVRCARDKDDIVSVYSAMQALDQLKFKSERFGNAVGSHAAWYIERSGESIK